MPQEQTDIAASLGTVVKETNNGGKLNYSTQPRFAEKNIGLGNRDAHLEGDANLRAIRELVANFQTAMVTFTEGNGGKRNANRQTIPVTNLGRAVLVGSDKPTEGDCRVIGNNRVIAMFNDVSISSGRLNVFDDGGSLKAQIPLKGIVKVEPGPAYADASGTLLPAPAVA